MTKKAIILCSGGIDSTTCFALAKAEGYACYALTFIYGQKHQIEVEKAKQIAKHFAAIEHRILTLPMGEYGGSSLTDATISVPDYQKDFAGISSTYVPARNTIFLSFALAWGEVIGAYDIFYGANCIDYSNYPDCRPEYLRAFETMAKLATKTGVVSDTDFKIHAPLLQMTKADIIREGLRLGIDYGQTISCYRPDPQGRSCGHCDSCTYRKKGFEDANVVDPTQYA